jgi:hypothetical protein
LQEGRRVGADSKVHDVIGWWVAAAAVVIALVVLGYCTYEVLWRLRRLRRDVASLTALTPEVAALQRRLQLVVERSSSIGSSRTAGGR